MAKFIVPTRFIGTWVHRNYGDHIIQGFRIKNLASIDLSLLLRQIKNQAKKFWKKCTEKNQQKIKISARHSSPLDARFTFDKFVVGKPNELAHAAAEEFLKEEK